MIVVIGAGMGGLAAATWLARRGRDVVLLEGCEQPGGLARGFVSDTGRAHDGGPYILLDRPGLSWAFERLGERLEDHLELHRIDAVYRVEGADRPPVTIYDDLDRTALGIEATWPGSGEPYRRFIREMAGHYEALTAMQRGPRPTPLRLLAQGGLSQVPFLLSSLHQILDRAGLPEPLRDALAIWTHIAGQDPSAAPSVLGFVPAVVHTHGAYVIGGGTGTLPRVLTGLARDAGVDLRLGTRVERIVTRRGRAVAVRTADGDIPCDAVVSGAAGLSTYLDLLDCTPARARRTMEALPLQSPGVAAYLEVPEDAPHEHFLRFHMEPDDPVGGCRVLVTPGAVDPAQRGIARLVSPTRHDWAERVGEQGQREFLAQVEAETWWHDAFPAHTVVQRRIPVDWGRRYLLHRDSMNPVMTARFMREGRVAHVSPHAKNLYLAGSSTHPGQWVSFCMISGVISAWELAGRPDAGIRT